ncbi:MAG: hypothetical protein V1882_07585 [Candidatus Omnitrophota bacterium]
MKKMTELGIRTSLLALWLCSLTLSVYAIAPEVLSKDAGENRLVRGVPATGSETVKAGIVPEQKPTASNDFLHGGSPLSNPNDKTPQNEVDLTSVKPPSEQEIRALVDQVLSRMANAGLGENLSKTLNYISNGDYAGLTAFQKENPGVINAFASALQDVSAPHIGTTPIVLPNEPPVFAAGGFGVSDPGSKSGNDYINRWLAEFRKVQARLSGPGMGADRPELLVSEVAKLYQPIATRISEVSKDVEEASHSLKGSNGRRTSSDDLLKDFSEKARKAIVDSLSQAQANLADGLLSNPIEATAFASETVPASGDAGGARKMLSPELYAKHRQYRVIDSVFIGKDFSYAQKMLHPPANLHPYLKWLLYTRNLTPRMMENYLKTREAAMTLYMRAKEGHGNIRYKGQVYGAFLPFAETAAGNFELVEPVSGK